jgi:hypothetical protein
MPEVPQTPHTQSSLLTFFFREYLSRASANVGWAYCLQ